jgi:hypothetical protein
VSGESTTRMLDSTEVDATVAHRIVGLCDSESGEYVEPPYGEGQPWISVGTSRLLLNSGEDIYKVRFLFELWDGQPPAVDENEWPRSELVSIYLPSGRVGVENPQFQEGIVFDVDRPGRYHLRLGWRPAEWDREGHEPQAFALAQFWG